LDAVTHVIVLYAPVRREQVIAVGDDGISLGGSMIDDVGIFRTTLGISALATPDRRRDLFDVMVDTGSEYTWIPASVLVELGVVPVRIDSFETADGRILERKVGFALVYAGGRSGPSVVVFALKGDVVLLGAHGLEGLNLRVDLARRELVPAGPLPAARAA
jgi:predicted aspartyl protease